MLVQILVGKQGVLWEMCKWQMAFLTGHSCRVLNSWWTGGARTKISACLADGLNQSLGLVSSVKQDDLQ